MDRVDLTFRATDGGSSSLSFGRRTLGFGPIRSREDAPLAREGETARGAVAFGLLLIVIGLLFLIDSLDLIEGVGFEELWPVLLITIGIAIIYDRVRRSWRRR